MPLTNQGFFRSIFHFKAGKYALFGAPNVSRMEKMAEWQKVFQYTQPNFGS
jgi:hypothetical protein